jgi:hypothetical protein
MPVVTISDADFNNLKAISEPFVDPSPEARISRLIRDEMGRMGVTASGNVSANGNGRARNTADAARRLNPDSHESLTFTKLVSATVDGREMHRPKWNSLRNHIHVLGLKRLGSCDALKRATGARIRQGRYEDDGYKYLPEGDFSIQGVDANAAWDHSLAVARTLRMPIKVIFQWREDGAHPGQTGVIEWSPAQS